MREETTFRQALGKAVRELPEKYRNGSPWCKLKSFPAGSCDLASNCLAQYLKDCGERGEPGILFMCGNETFREEENSTVHGHVIVILDGEYIDLMLDARHLYLLVHHARAAGSGAEAPGAGGAAR